jgi:hypothetical protein
MKDKQTRDGSFISNVINNGLLVNMRALGFAIPEETKAVLKNDAEIIEMNNTIIAQAVEIKKAGLQVDEAYFTKQTGIPVAAPPEPVKAPLPIQPLPEKIKDKLQKIYNHANHQS